MRTAITVVLIVSGLAIQAVSYLVLAAPAFVLSTSEAHSNPRVEFAPAVFILGVMMVFLAAVVYELLPERFGK